MKANADMPRLRPVSGNPESFFSWCVGITVFRNLCCKQENRQRQEVGIRVHTDEHRDAHADRGNIADPG